MRSRKADTMEKLGKAEIAAAAGLSVAIIGGITVYFARNARRANKASDQPNPAILKSPKLKSIQLAQVNLLAAYILYTPKPTISGAQRVLDFEMDQAEAAVGILQNNKLIETHELEDGLHGARFQYTASEALAAAADDASSYPMLNDAIKQVQLLSPHD